MNNIDKKMKVLKRQFDDNLLPEKIYHERLNKLLDESEVEDKKVKQPEVMGASDLQAEIAVAAMNKLL